MHIYGEFETRNRSHKYIEQMDVGIALISALICLNNFTGNQYLVSRWNMISNDLWCHSPIKLIIYSLDLFWYLFQLNFPLICYQIAFLLQISLCSSKSFTMNQVYLFWCQTEGRSSTPLQITDHRKSVEIQNILTRLIKKSGNY